jgi:hypothetical protein
VSGLKRAQAAAPLVVVLVAAMVALLAAINFWNVTGNSCPANVASGLTPTGAFAAIVGAFFVGGLLGKLPHKNPSRGAQLAAGEPVAGVWAQAWLTLLAGLLAVAWWYETKAVADPSLQAITHYIMCIRHTADEANEWVLAVLILGGLMAGRWLWHRDGVFW